MPGLFVINSETQPYEQAVQYEGDEVILLIVIDKGTLATKFDNSMDGLEGHAKEISRKITGKGIKCRTVVEWGDKTEVVSNTLIRENAALLNKF